jgi:hypothetical protein
MLRSASALVTILFLSFPDTEVCCPLLSAERLLAFSAQYLGLYQSLAVLPKITIHRALIKIDPDVEPLRSGSFLLRPFVDLGTDTFRKLI